MIDSYLDNANFAPFKMKLIYKLDTVLGDVFENLDGSTLILIAFQSFLHFKNALDAEWNLL